MKTRDLILLMGILVMVWLYFFHPPLILQRKAEALFKEFSETVATHDREQIRAMLTNYISDKAKITLTVNLSFALNQTAQKQMTQEFDKEAFITFIDNILYSMTSYSYLPLLRVFKVSDDRKSAQIYFDGTENANGPGYYSGVQVGMRFRSTSKCKGSLVIDGSDVMLDQVTCTLNVRAAPGEGEAKKLPNYQELQQRMR